MPKSYEARWMPIARFSLRRTGTSTSGSATQAVDRHGKPPLEVVVGGIVVATLVWFFGVGLSQQVFEASDEQGTMPAVQGGDVTQRSWQVVLQPSH